MKNKELAIKLMKTDKESDVIKLLKKMGYWEDHSQWKPYGNIENNFSIIGNQQSSPESALVEKIVNSIDAVLIKECLVRGIHPESPEAPSSVKTAVNDFFHVYNGSLSNIDASQRNLLAEQIEMVATGYKTRPTFSIIDDGEGQYPEDFEKTFLSLAKSNKVKIGFVQGKFNMGGSGVLQFCGKHNLQLIVSKRNKDISDDSDWGITIIRRQKPKGNSKSSMYTYLAPEGKILTFKAKSLKVRPTEYPNAHGRELESGTFMKLYEYNLSGGLKSNLKFDLFYKLNELMPEIALPVRMFERREGYKGTTMQITLNGLKIRLGDTKDKLEEGYPNSFKIGNVVGELFVFKEDTAKNYVGNDNIIFTVNGQTHGTLPKRFFNLKAVGMGSLRDSILIILDCTNLSPTDRENLFMNSRDRLRDSKIRENIENKLKDYVGNHKGLKDIKIERRNKRIQETIEDQRPFKEAMEDIIGHSKVLSSLFLGKGELKNPLKTFIEKTKDMNYEGQRFPSFFDLKTKTPKDAQIKRQFRVQFATDAQNDYFSRENERGELFLYLGRKRHDYSVNLWNGFATLTIDLPEGVKVGDSLNFRTEMWDNSHPEPFESRFTVNVIKKKEIEPSPKKEKEEVDKPITATSEMPNIIEVNRDTWSKYNFNKKDCLEIMNNGELGFDFVINMDNYYLLTEISSVKDEEIELIKTKYKYAISIIGMALIRSNMEDRSKDLSKVFAPIIIPLTELSTLNLDAQI